MAGYTYTTYVEAIQKMAVTNGADVDFTAIIPSTIDYAEQRIYRELNLISTVQTDTTQTTTSGSRALSIPNTFVTVTNINLLTPAGAGSANGTRVALTPVSRDVLDSTWPSNTLTAVPSSNTVFCMVTQWSALIGPAPDDAYTAEIVGTTRPAALSDTNPTTFISERLPDLFLAASMVFISGYQRNFGIVVNDPQAGTTWEQQYTALKASADTEEIRKRFSAASWSSQPVIPQAQPQRG